MSDETFFGRWSRRKLAARRGETAAPEPAPAQRAPEPAPVAQGEAPATAETSAPLPALDSLTAESDFAPFMRADVDPATRGEALKTLFGDPRYNVMDGLDVYIDDYSKPDPLPEGWLEKLNQFAAIDPQPQAPREKPGTGMPTPDAHDSVRPGERDPGDGRSNVATETGPGTAPDPS